MIIQACWVIFECSGLGLVYVDWLRFVRHSVLCMHEVVIGLSKILIYCFVMLQWSNLSVLSVRDSVNYSPKFLVVLTLPPHTGALILMIST